MSIFIRKLLTSQCLFCSMSMVLAGAIIAPNVAHANDSGIRESIINQQKHTVTGVVSDENGIPLPGVVVSIAGTTTGDVTKANGEYTINVATGDILEYSFIGYKKQTIKVGTEALVNVKLEIEGLTGDEVVIVGFGTMKKSSLTGSISVVTADQIADRPVQSVGQALQGIVPGLNLTTGDNGGSLDGSYSVNIRGGGTIGDGSKGGVLVLIDGMEGDMNTLNPQDIESFSIMKDAASATIYGSRAPFGVILITTKKGAKGKAKVNYNNNFRFSSPLLVPEYMDSYSFANYFNEGAKNVGGGNVYSDDTMEKILKYQAGELKYGTEIPDGDNPTWWPNYSGAWANNDWFDVHYEDWVFSQEHNASVSGGSEKIQYYIAAGWLDQNGILTYSDDSYARYSFSSKINAEITSWAKVGVTTRFVRTDNEMSTYQHRSNNVFFHNLFRRFPTVPLDFPEIPGSTWDKVNYGDSNEVAQMQYGGRTEKLKDVLYQQINVTVEPIENWTITAEMNYRINNNKDNVNILPLFYQLPNGELKGMSLSSGVDKIGLSQVTSNSRTTNFMNPNIYTNYVKNFDSGHSFKAMVGFQSESNKYSEMYAEGQGLLVQTLPNLGNTTEEYKVWGTPSNWATAGFFTRLNYDYKEKYLLEVSARYDGTSRFLEDKRWNLFPSVSVGWNMKNEAFLEDVAAIDMIKFRGSWGQLGNQNTSSAYPFYQSIPIKQNHQWMANGQRIPIYAETPGLVSSLLGWETVESWNIGLDFGFFRNRLIGSIDVFNRKTLDMVGPAPSLPDVLGVNVPKINNADLESKGWEIEIAWRDVVQSIGLSYGIRANLSDSRQHVTRYPNEAGTMKISDTNFPWYSGKSNGEIWGYTTVGIAQTQAEMDAHLEHTKQPFHSSWGAGDIMYKDLNGDGTISDGESKLGSTGDLSVIGNSTPRYTYGINADLAWKGFDFSIFIQGVGKKDFKADGFVYYGQAGGGMWGSTGLTPHADYWRPTDTESIFGANTDAYFAKAYLGGEAYKNQKTQTKYLQDASYMRIKNIQIGYTLPSRISDKLSMQNVRVFFSADNIATFTDLIETYDPEILGGTSHGSGRNYPLSKVISFGVNVTL